MQKADRWITQIEAIKKSGKLGDSVFADFDKAKNDLNNAKKGTNELETAFYHLNKSYLDITAQNRLFNAEQTRTTKILREQEHLSNIQRQATELLESNPKVYRSVYKKQLEDLIENASSGNIKSENLQTDLSRIRQEMDSLGLTSETVGQKLQRLFHDHFNTAVAMAGLHLLQSSLQQILQNVIDVDTAMTDLKKVSNGSESDYAKYLDSAADRAKNLGASITDVIGATTEFSRLGYNLEDASNLGDWATKYMNVSEYTNIEDAAQSLVSTLQGFHLSADEVGNVVDKFNEIKCLSLCA